jgi:hypothetical protein
MEYDIERSGKCCATTGREFAPGEAFYSVLAADAGGYKRSDFCMEAWHGPPPGAVAYWKSQMPSKTAPKPPWAPNEALLDFLDELAEQPDKQDMRYVLALLLVRRRVLRLEEEIPGDGGPDGGPGKTIFYCPRRDATHEIEAIVPSSQRADEIQQILAKLLER